VGVRCSPQVGFHAGRGLINLGVPTSSSAKWPVAGLSSTLDERAELRWIEMTRLRKFAGKHVQPGIGPEIEDAVQVELVGPRVRTRTSFTVTLNGKYLPSPSS